jgi:hypothetical protein
VHLDLGLACSPPSRNMRAFSVSSTCILYMPSMVFASVLDITSPAACRAQAPTIVWAGCALRKSKVLCGRERQRVKSGGPGAECGSWLAPTTRHGRALLPGCKIARQSNSGARGRAFLHHTSSLGGCGELAATPKQH